MRQSSQIHLESQCSWITASDVTMQMVGFNPKDCDIGHTLANPTGPAAWKLHCIFVVLAVCLPWYLALCLYDYPMKFAR